MSLRVLVVSTLACTACVTPEARADVSVEVDVAGPPIAFEEEPGLVEVEPGVAIVPDLAEEVFFIDGWYWYRWQGSWYRCNDWRGAWQLAAPPPIVVGLPHGHFRNWHTGRVVRPGRPVMVRPPAPRVAPPPGPRVPPPRAPQAPHGPVIAPHAPTQSPGRTAIAPPPPQGSAPATHRPAPPPPAPAPHRRGHH